ncbi:MAG: acetyl-CoA carboxylase biotin carboxyl carrier protein [Tenericutes bacterium HGW-Tenericutes-2]|jgi:acetyl-CoA carboxylase biotin carboxyl carrier protein|nr:MAG: acetyl-CoA carboxylase biotin carboxyl carrier protein [Tenericutes bacterium HGW-Tenericutes-2]
MTIKEIQSIIKDFESSSLMSLELEMDTFKLRLSKNKTNEVIVKEDQKEDNKPQQTHASTTPKVELNNNHTMIKSPLVGTFYAASTPTGKPFVEVGSHVKKGQVVCIIEAMKIMNEITSPYEGIVKEVFVRNGDVVGFNHGLIRIGDANEK